MSKSGCGCSQELAQLGYTMQQHNEALYKLADGFKRHLQVTLPSDIDERSYVGSGTSITLNPQSRNKVRITSVMVQVTSAAVLTIGDRVFTLAAGFYTWHDLKWILGPGDVRTLVQTTPGALSLELMGTNLVNTGVW